MKKVFGMIALAVALAACNKNEIDLQPMEQPFDNAGGITITATLASKNVGTRAVTDDGSNIVVDWAKNEHLAILYEVDGVKKAADAEITGVDGDGTATISFTVDGSTANNTPCTIVYPLSAAKDDNSGRKSDTELLSMQDGKLSAALDVRVGAGTIQPTTTGLTVTTQPEPQFAIARFTIQDLSGNAKNVSFFKFYYWEEGNMKEEAIVTPSPAADVLYVALPAFSGKKPYFYAVSGGTPCYAKVYTTTMVETGKYYQSTLKMATVGNVIGIDGLFYINKEAAETVNDNTAEAMIAFIGDGSETFDAMNFTNLAIALQDASDDTLSWDDANGAISIWANRYHRINTTNIYGGWILPDINAWKAMFRGCGGHLLPDTGGGGENFNYGNFRTLLTTAGGTDIHGDHYGDYYWSGTESGPYNAWGFCFYNNKYLGTPAGQFYTPQKTSKQYVRYCFEFF